MGKRSLSAGAAAEAYVYYRLRSWGISTYFASGGGASPFDLWTEYEGQVLKIQVKSTSRKIHHGKYVFSTKKGSNGLYHEDDWDIMALVALREEAVWFTLRGKGRKTRRIDSSFFSTENEKISWEKVTAAIKKRASV